MRFLIVALGGALLSGGCTLTKQEQTVDVTAAYNVAAAAEASYAARPGADPRKVAQADRLLQAAQAALLSWSNSSAPADQEAADAAIAALVAYEAELPAAAGASPGH